MARISNYTVFQPKSTSAPVVYETHAHTVLCQHASGPIDAYCQRALRLGLSGIIFTEHNPMPDEYSHQKRLQAHLLPTYVQLVRQVKTKFADALDVRLGIECDYLPEYESFLKEQIALYPFDYVIGSVHCQFPEFHNYASASDPEHFLAVYFDLLASSAETGLFDSIAHPHLANSYLKYTKEIDHRTINLFVDRMAETGVAIELNTGGQKYWDSYLYAAAAFRNIPVILGADAHAPGHVGDLFEEGLGFLRQVGYRKITTFLGSERHECKIETALEHLCAVRELGI